MLIFGTCTTGGSVFSYSPAKGIIDSVLWDLSSPSLVRSKKDVAVGVHGDTVIICGGRDSNFDMVNSARGVFHLRSHCPAS